MTETYLKIESHIAKSTQVLLKETWKFSDNTTVIKFIAALLYFMKRGFLSLKNNVPENDGIVISRIHYFNVPEDNGDVISSIQYLVDNENSQKIESRSEFLVVDMPYGDPNYSYIKIFDIIKDGKTAFNCGALHDYVRTVFDSIVGPDEYLIVFDIAFADFLGMMGRNSFGEFVQPKELAELASRLIDVRGKTVFNPYSGMMSYATTLKGYSQYTGVERNATTWELGADRVLLAGLEDRVSCIHGDVARWTEKKYDIIVSTPPLGGFLPIGPKYLRMRTDGVCLNFFDTTTTQQGVLFSYVSPSLLTDGTTGVLKLRRKITEQNLLDTVIILPPNLMQPYTSISLAAIILRKGRALGEPVKMLDASKLSVDGTRKPILDVEALVNRLDEMVTGDCTYVTREEIMENDYSWSVVKYIGLHDEVFPEGYEVLRLNEIVEIVHGDRHFDDKKGHLARISNLSSEASDCVKSVDSFEETTDLSNSTKITEPVILLSTVREPRPTYCEASENNPIFVHPNIMVCRVTNAEVSPTYLCLELSKRVVLSVGGFVQRLTRSTLLETKVALPSIGQQRSLEEQNNLYNAAADNLKMTKAKELGLLEVIDKMKTEYMNEVRSRKHDMKTPMAQLRSTLKLLDALAKELPEEASSKLNVYSQRQKVALDTLSEIVQHLADEEHFGTPDILDVDEILSKLVVKDSLYDIEYCKDEVAFMEAHIKTPKVKMEREKFLRLVNNIVGNAIEHGFTDKSNHYTLVIYSNIIDNFLIITFQNDGTPMPEGMDKSRYGTRNVKGKDSKGHGDGGSIVKNIVEHYGGDYDLSVEETNDVKLTNVVVKLPIYRDDE